MNAPQRDPGVVSMREWQRRAVRKAALNNPKPVFPPWHAWILLSLVAALSTIFGQGTPPASSAPAIGFQCQVASITDGDTLRCADGTRIRLSGIAARERDGSCSPGHPCPAAPAAAATDALTRLALGRTITCDADGTSYGG